MPFRDSRLDRENDRFRNLGGETVVAVQVDKSVLPDGAATESTALDIKQNTANTVGQLLAVNDELNTVTSELVKANQSLDALELHQTNGTQKTQVFDPISSLSARIVPLGTVPVVGDPALVGKSVIIGKTTGGGGGGGFVDVKVTPSGALVTESTVVSSVLPTGAATEATQVLNKTELIKANASLDVIEDNTLLRGEILNGQIILNASPVKVCFGVNNQVGRKNLVIFNYSDSDIFYGGPSVTPTTGLPILAKGFVGIDVSDQIDIYITSIDAGLDIRFQEAR